MQPSTVSPGLGKDFHKFLFGQAVSNVGSSFTMFALPLLVFSLTGSALNLAIITAAEYLPHLLFGLFIGAWVDRVDRRLLMIFTDVTQALVIGSIPLLASLGMLTVWWIYVVGFVSSTLWILFDTAEFAAVPSLAQGEELVKANGRLQATYSAASVAGPLLAGLMVAVAPIQTVLVFDDASFLVSVAALAWIRTSFNAAQVEEPAKRFLHEIAEGLRYVLGHPVLRNTAVMMALLNCIGYTVYAQLVLFSKERLDASDTEVGLLYAAGSVGMIALALAAAPLRRRFAFGTVALGALMVGGVAIVFMALTREYWVAVSLWAVIWGLVILFQINSNSLWQAIVPARLLGRAQSVVNVISWSAIPLGAFAGALLIEQTQNVALVYGAIGVLITVAAFAFSFTALGHAERYLPEEKAGEQKAPVH